MIKKETAVNFSRSFLFILKLKLLNYLDSVFVFLSLNFGSLLATKEKNLPHQTWGGSANSGGHVLKDRKQSAGNSVFLVLHEVFYKSVYCPLPAKSISSIRSLVQCGFQIIFF